MTIRVLTADDHPVVRTGISAIVANQPDMSVVAEAVDGLDAVALYDTHSPDVVLMDLRMPRLDGIGAIRASYPPYTASSLYGRVAQVQEYTQGSLIVDVIDPTTQELIWRGQGVAVVSSDPAAYGKDLAQSVTAILKKFPQAGA